MIGNDDKELGGVEQDRERGFFPSPGDLSSKRNLWQKVLGLCVSYSAFGLVCGLRFTVLAVFRGSRALVKLGLHVRVVSDKRGVYLDLLSARNILRHLRRVISFLELSCSRHFCNLCGTRSMMYVKSFLADPTAEDVP